MSNWAPDPAIVAAIYDIDPDSLTLSICASTPLVINPDEARRYDGRPASPEQVAALKSARRCDLQAVLDLHRHALAQAQYELERKERIVELLGKYWSGDDDEYVDEILPRMTPDDRAEYLKLWDDLGNFMVLGGSEQ